jgi:hypothetical protein
LGCFCCSKEYTDKDGDQRTTNTLNYLDHTARDAEIGSQNRIQILQKFVTHLYAFTFGDTIKAATHLKP